jgi:hypothetical protein
MASSRRICWVTTTRPTDGAWINTDKTLPASLFSSKKKELRKVGLSNVGTGKISALLTDKAWIDADNPLPASLFSTN